MSIKQVLTSNTFFDWVNTTNEIVDTLNLFTDGGSGNTFYANTNLTIANNLTISGNLTVSGNVTLDNIGYNDLTISGNATINLAITGGNTTLTNLIVTNNVNAANITTTLKVGGNTTVYGNLSVSQNSTVENLIVTDNIVFPPLTTLTLTTLNVTNNVTVTGNLGVSGNSTLNNVTIDYLNISTANVTSLVGSANTQIYNYIDATLNTTSANGLAESYLAFAIALG